MILPLPVKKNRFGENVANISTTNYYRQIVEEVLEAHEEAVIFDHENELCFESNISDEFWNAEAEELVDVITCCVTRFKISVTTKTPDKNFITPLMRRTESGAISMVNLDYDLIQNMLYEYLDGDFDGKSEAIASELSDFNERLSEVIENNFLHGELYYVLNICMPDITDDDVKLIKNIDKLDVAYIASHFGFLFGMLYSENVRIHFYEEQ